MTCFRNHARFRWNYGSCMCYLGKLEVSSSDYESFQTNVKSNPWNRQSQDARPRWNVRWQENRKQKRSNAEKGKEGQRLTFIVVLPKLRNPDFYFRDGTCGIQISGFSFMKIDLSILNFSAIVISRDVTHNWIERMNDNTIINGWRDIGALRSSVPIYIAVTVYEKMQQRSDETYIRW